MENSAAIEATHVVTYKGHQRSCTPENYHEVVDGLIKEFGVGAKPTFERISSVLLALQDELESTVQVLEAKGEEVSEPVFGEPEGRGVGNVSLSGKLRSLGDEQLALEGGFAPAPPNYAVGTRVVQLGVDNSRREQLKHDAKPPAKQLCADGYQHVLAEDRRDTQPLITGDLRMDKSGLIVVPEGEPGAGKRYPLTPRAFNSVFGRFPCASGNSYLSSCPTKLRSINFNHWAVETMEQQGDDNKTVLRLRNGPAGREVFASVSPTYTAFDADKILLALEKAFPEDARGSLDYTGERLRVEGLWRTDVAPEEFVAGEFFKAGVIVRSDDTGGGSIRVQSVLWRNLCLNLIILDRAIGVDIRLKHAGSVNSLARKFRSAFSEALGSVEPFRKAWGSAMAERDETLVERVQGTTSENISKLPATAVLPGLFNGILERELVPVKGRRKDVVPKLLEMHTQDEAADAYGVSRASVVNAFTRYAHQVETDPFLADEIRAGAGKLLSGRAGRQPAPLPYAPITV